MDLGEGAHLPKPITLHVNFSSFVFHILLLDVGFPRWSVNLAFSTSFFTALLRAGAGRPRCPQRFFCNISCYFSTKSSKPVLLRGRFCPEILSSTVLLPLLPLLSVLRLLRHRLLEWWQSHVLMRTPCPLWRQRQGGSRGPLAQVPSHCWAPLDIPMVK